MSSHGFSTDFLNQWSLGRYMQLGGSGGSGGRGSVTLRLAAIFHGCNLPAQLREIDSGRLTFEWFRVGGGSRRLRPGCHH